MPKLIKVNDNIHARLMDARVGSETAGDVIERLFNTEQKDPALERIEAGIEDIKLMLEAPEEAQSDSAITPEKNIAGASPFIEETHKGRRPAGVKNLSVATTKDLRNEMACCNNVQPCRHWSWDVPLQLWKNSLSGRTMEARL